MTFVLASAFALLVVGCLLFCWAKRGSPRNVYGEFSSQDVTEMQNAVSRFYWAQMGRAIVSGQRRRMREALQEMRQPQAHAVGPVTYPHEGVQGDAFLTTGSRLNVNYQYVLRRENDGWVVAGSWFAN